MQRFVHLAICCFLVTGSPLYAQSLSAADILKQVDEKVSGLNDYQALLNDPDPARSMAAMEIMINSGDTILERMALEYGIYSPNPSVQRAALDAYFASKPTLDVYFDAGSSNSDWRFYKPLTQAGGSILQDGTGYMPSGVGAFDPDQNCYLKAGQEQCRARVTDNGVSVHFWNNWYNLKLNDQGELSGAGAFPGINSVATVIPINK